VFTGIGKGAYYVGHPEYKRRILAKLGYIPYPGTLNLRLRRPSEIGLRKQFRESRGVRIEAFEHGGERFSGLNCFDGEMNGVRVTLLIVEITHYDDSVMELIAPLYLRGELGIRDGDRVTVTIRSC
jgi:riboflavin kinase